MFLRNLVRGDSPPIACDNSAAPSLTCDRKYQSPRPVITVSDPFLIMNMINGSPYYLMCKDNRRLVATSARSKATRFFFNPLDSDFDEKELPFGTDTKILATADSGCVSAGSSTTPAIRMERDYAFLQHDPKDVEFPFSIRSTGTTFSIRNPTGKSGSILYGMPIILYSAGDGGRYAMIDCQNKEHPLLQSSSDPKPNDKGELNVGIGNKRFIFPKSSYTFYLLGTNGKIECQTTINSMKAWCPTYDPETKKSRFWSKECQEFCSTNQDVCDTWKNEYCRGSQKASKECACLNPNEQPEIQKLNKLRSDLIEAGITTNFPNFECFYTACKDDVNVLKTKLNEDRSRSCQGVNVTCTNVINGSKQEVPSSFLNLEDISGTAELFKQQCGVTSPGGGGGSNGGGQTPDTEDDEDEGEGSPPPWYEDKKTLIVIGASVAMIIIVIIVILIIRSQRQNV